MPTIDSGPAADLAAGDIKLVGDGSILIVEAGGRIHALQSTCTHEDWSLEDGWVDDVAITCPLHASRFSIVDGAVLDPPATVGLRTYPCEVRDGRIFVTVEDVP